MDWRSKFDERELQEIDLCCEYVNNYTHARDDHRIRTIVTKMASILDDNLGQSQSLTQVRIIGPNQEDVNYPS